MCEARDQALALAEQRSAGFDPPAGYWVRDMHHSRECDDYCPDCIDKAVAAASVSGLWCDDPDEQDWEHPFADGGFGGTSVDSVPFCEDCGRMLRYSLSAYGAAEEIAHFLDHGVGPGPEDAYAVASAIEGSESRSAADWTRLAALLAATPPAAPGGSRHD